MISKIWYLKIWMKKNKQQQKWGAKNILSYYFNINLKSLQSLNIAMQKHPLVDVQQNTCVIQNKTFQKHFSLTASFRVFPWGAVRQHSSALCPTDLHCHCWLSRGMKTQLLLKQTNKKRNQRFPRHTWKKGCHINAL